MAGSALCLALLVASAAFGAYRLETFLGLTTTRTTRILAVWILAVAQVQTVALALGTVGLLSRVPILAAQVAVGGALGLLPVLRPPAPRRSGDDKPASGGPGWLTKFLCVAVVAFAVARWIATSVYVTKVGFQDFDTLEYHLSMAARFLQLHDVTHLQYVYPQLPITYYPLNGELLYAVTIGATGTDVWIAFFNVAWLGLLLLAAWSIGCRYHAGYVSVAGVAALASTPLLVDSFAGTAMIDMFAVAMLIAGIALLVTEGFRPATLLVGGLAVGTAAGAKYTTLLAGGALTLGLIVWLARSARSRLAAFWAAGVLWTGSYWYARNLWRAGSPLPDMHLSIGRFGFPHADLRMPQAMSILHYAGQPAVLGQIVSNLSSDFGRLDYLLLAAVLAGIGASLGWGTDGWARLLGAVALVCTLGYLAIPSTAYGPPGHPEYTQATDYNVRYALPAMVLALILLPSARRMGSASLQTVVVGTFALIALACQLPAFQGSSLVTHLSGASLVPGAITVAMAGLLIWATLRLPAGRRRAAAIGAVALGTGVAVVVAPTLGHRWQNRYQPITGATSRYTQLYQWTSRVSHSQIGTVGLMYYPLYGRAYTNTVSYVGWLGPHGALHDFTSCPSFLLGVARGHYQYLVIQESDPPYDTVPPAAKWAESDPGLVAVLHGAGQTVFRVSGPVSPEFCRSAPSQVMARASTGGDQA